jgi:hypothetical protein
MCHSRLYRETVVVAAELAALMTRLKRLEDIEEIIRLKHRYCLLCDQNYDGEKIVKLFTPDGIWDAGELYGRFAGHDAMREFFRNIPASVSFAMHTAMNPIIDIEGETARATWQAVNPSTIMAGGKSVPHWSFSEYEDRLAKVDGRWLFTYMRSNIKTVAPHRDGWV